MLEPSSAVKDLSLGGEGKRQTPKGSVRGRGGSYRPEDLKDSQDPCSTQREEELRGEQAVAGLQGLEGLSLHPISNGWKGNPVNTFQQGYGDKIKFVFI